MNSGFKRANNIGRIQVPKYDQIVRSRSNDSLFERDWEELVIRFDEVNRRFVVHVDEVHPEEIETQPIKCE